MSLTLAVLSWGARKTLKNTLESYKKYELDIMADERIIWFNEISPLDTVIAREYGYTPYGSNENIGIAGGYKELVAKATGSLFLFLENDWELIEWPKEQIITGAVLLETNTVDIVRYRHRINHGYPLWSTQFAGDEMSRPEYLLESIHWDANPERHLDPMTGRQIITKLPYGWYITDARYAAWTNNPTMFRTSWIRAMARDFEGDVEKAMNQSFYNLGLGIKVAQGNGLFTHNRIE